ncbi:MAG: hypothetical protein K6B54_07590 [Clostridia bacterium]|nr:hypothetical protein [Clostridia bacterium]
MAFAATLLISDVADCSHCCAFPVLLLSMFNILGHILTGFNDFAQIGAIEACFAIALTGGNVSRLVP